MATILATFGSGGSGLTPGGSSSSPSLATVLRDIADDLAALKGGINAVAVPTAAADVGAIVAANIGAVGTANAAATAIADATGDVGAGALANDLKAKYNAAVTLINELKTIQATNLTLENELKTNIATVRTLVNDLKAKYNAMANVGYAPALKTIKG